MKGILTYKDTGETEEIDVDYEIEMSNNFIEEDAIYFRLIIRLFPPPDDLIGYMGFCIEDVDKLGEMAKNGWIARDGCKNKLFIPAEEMRNVIEKEIMNNIDNSEDLKTKHNIELIDKFEEAANEYTIILKKIVIKRMNGEIPDEEYKRVENISSSLTTNILDVAFANGYKKEQLKRDFDNIINDVTNKNR